jgi:Phospholipase_D-nuclease N-terminal
VNLAALVPVIVIGAGFVVFCLVDLARAQKVRYLPKWVWALICLVSVPLGGILYLSLGRARRDPS